MATTNGVHRFLFFQKENICVFFNIKSNINSLLQVPIIQNRIKRKVKIAPGL